MDNEIVTDNDEAVLKAFGGAAKHNLNEIINNCDDLPEDVHNFTHSPYYDIESISNKDISKNGNKILSINIQSINAKFDAFSGFLQILKEKNIIFDVILLQEIWISDDLLSQKEYSAMFNLPGYNLISQGKICCGHGGLFTYVRDFYKCKQRKNLYKKSDVYEALYVDIKHEHLLKKLTVGNIYRPSKNKKDYQNVATFVKEIEPFIEILDKENSFLIFGGDYNANLLEISNKENYQDFFYIFVSRGIFPKITLPTRFATKSASLIDNIFCKLPDINKNGNSGIFVSKLSDHLPIFTCQDFLKAKINHTKFITVQEKTSSSINDFHNFIESSLRETHFESDLTTDPNINYDKLENILIQGNEKCFPIKTKRFNKYKHKLNPWMTAGILRSIKFRDKLYKSLKTYPLNLLYTLLTRQTLQPTIKYYRVQ